MRKLKKKTAKKPSKSTKRTGFDPHSCTIDDVMGIMGVSAPALTQWGQKGCPVPAERGKWDVAAVVRWKVADERQGDPKTKEEVRKLENQNALLESKIAEEKRESIPREKVERVAAMQVAALRAFLTEGCMRNVDRFINKQRDELLLLFKDFAKEALNKFIKSGVNADDL